MKIQKMIIALALLGAMFSVFAQTPRESLANEIQQVEFAERVVTIEFVRALSHSAREAKEKCSSACPETGALELGIGLIGISQSDAGSNALINLLGLRLDGAGSEDLSCQILIRGSRLLERLEKVNADSISAHCRAGFNVASKQALDVQVGQVCRSESEIRSALDELTKAIKSKTKCEQ